MIKIKALDKPKVNEQIIKSTIFPDKTSQVWKLNDDILNAKLIEITWNFEEEREIIDLLSLRKLLVNPLYLKLSIPYLPYARQDHTISNTTTFNLQVFADLINSMKFTEVETVDPHSNKCKDLINNLNTLNVNNILKTIVKDKNIDVLVLPDLGSSKRGYSIVKDFSDNIIIMDKERDPTTGNITGMRIETCFISKDSEGLLKYLIIDDICDGGATFINVANIIKEQHEKAHVTLFVTHGIFSKTKQHLLDNGIDEILTTNTLLSNKLEDGMIFDIENLR